MGKYKFDIGAMLREEQAKQERLAQSSDPRQAENAARSVKELTNVFPGAKKHLKPPKK